MKYYIITIFIINIFTLYSLNLNMKEKIWTENNEVYLKNLVIENIDNSIGNILICFLDKDIKKISIDFLLKKLFENNIFDIFISGNECIIYKINKDNENLEIKQENKEKSKNPLIKFIEESLSNYLDKKNFIIKVDITKVEPDINMNEINNNFNIEIEKFDYGFKDICNLKKVNLIYNNKKYNVYIDLKIFSNVYISNRKILNNEKFKKNDFIKSYVDITAYKNPENIVYDINNLENYKIINFLNSGDVLRWDNIKRIPLIVKNEWLKIIIKRFDLEIIIPCKALSESYENEKVKVKLLNGNEKIGILRNKNGEIYVEIN